MGHRGRRRRRKCLVLLRDRVQTDSNTGKPMLANHQPTNSQRGFRPREPEKAEGWSGPTGLLRGQSQTEGTERPFKGTRFQRAVDRLPIWGAAPGCCYKVAGASSIKPRAWLDPARLSSAVVSEARACHAMDSCAGILHRGTAAAARYSSSGSRSFCGGSQLWNHPGSRLLFVSQLNLTLRRPSACCVAPICPFPS